MTDEAARYYASRAVDDGRTDDVLSVLADSPLPAPPRVKSPRFKRPQPSLDDYSVEALYRRLQSLSVEESKGQQCREIAEHLVTARQEAPNLLMYNALILSNVSAGQGSAQRVYELLDQMGADGLQPDVQTCHAVLKVAAVHSDHLLRTGVLAYMGERWLELSVDGAHDLVGGLLREGRFEQAVERLDKMREDNVPIQPWLLDMMVYALCAANEVSEAYRIMRWRVDAHETELSRTLWSFLLDKASAARHHAATAMAWSSQVVQKYINPSSAVCLNVLATAAQAGDAIMATEVFTQLSKRGTTFEPIHYELLISAYLAMNPPDVERAITVLTIMALEKLDPSATETRPLYLCLRDRPDLIPRALQVLRNLHTQNRIIPVAALNVLIECYVEQGNLLEALKIYKQMHTFAPNTDNARKSIADIETFNLLIRGCNRADPPDTEQATFLLAELLALGLKPTALTYDRLVLVFANAGMKLIDGAAEEIEPGKQATNKAEGLKLMDTAYGHFADMRGQNLPPRFGTVESLSAQLARLGDERCWDVLQAGEDSSKGDDAWSKLGPWARKNAEEAWARAMGTSPRKP